MISTHMKSLEKSEFELDSPESAKKRDSLLLKLLHTPPHQRPKRDRKKPIAGEVANEGKSERSA